MYSLLRWILLHKNEGLDTYDISEDEDEVNEGEMVEVLDKRFLNLSRPLRIFLVAESRVVVSGASVVWGRETRLPRLNRGRLPKSLSRPPGEEVVVEVGGEVVDLVGATKGISKMVLYELAELPTVRLFIRKTRIKNYQCQ